MDGSAPAKAGCPECGVLVDGRRASCQVLFDELSAQAYADLQYAASQQLAFDTYCMRHVDPYCRSAKSYAAHLTRLCCGLEYGKTTPSSAGFDLRLFVLPDEFPGHCAESRLQTETVRLHLAL
jgi:Family of unknown function (DUF5946)